MSDYSDAKRQYDAMVARERAKAAAAAADHLPECWWAVPKAGKPTVPCICSELRACRERTLDAARDAVAALPESVMVADEVGYHDEWLIAQALAAIDALKGKA